MRNHKSRWQARRTWRAFEQEMTPIYRQEGLQPPNLTLDRRESTKDFLFLHRQGRRNIYVTRMAAL